MAEPLHVFEALSAADPEAGFNRDELRGDDARDAKIRRQISVCALFIPLSSANTNARDEACFRLEWKLFPDDLVDRG
jgi:hypothetical protein